jgi:hypothetical protein
MPRSVVTLSRLSFGIYLLHPLFIEVLWRGFPLGALPLPVGFALLMAAGLLVSALATIVLGRTRLGPWFIGRVHLPARPTPPSPRRHCYRTSGAGISTSDSSSQAAGSTADCAVEVLRT